MPPRALRQHTEDWHCLILLILQVRPVFPRALQAQQEPMPSACPLEHAALTDTLAASLVFTARNQLRAAPVHWGAEALRSLLRALPQHRPSEKPGPSSTGQALNKIYQCLEHDSLSPWQVAVF